MPTGIGTAREAAGEEAVEAEEEEKSSVKI